MLRRLVQAALVFTVLGGAAGPRVLVRGRTVWLDGAAAWHGAVTSPLVWSADSAAVAFTGRDARGRAALVVLLPGPQAISWPIPASAQPARAVTWLGPTKIGAGPSVLEPRVIASFTVER